ncbi:hypothetical protein [Rubrivivax sp. JA1026]|uniref:hypothetical protein n=1 Tax=Rubrivivax sp. JA1026 TaxID=2710888 RepID=UPI0013E9796C|nr:hypothetical protein [Rubrivivax sp. JA1026]
MPFVAVLPQRLPCPRRPMPAEPCARIVDADIRRTALAVLALTATVWWPSAPRRVQSLASFTRSDSRA